MKRIIASILIDSDDCVKTRKFKEPVYLGDPINIVKLFSNKCADELIISDISIDRFEKGPNFKLLEKMCAQARMPIAYGGGVRDITDVDRLINMGIERINLNTSFFDNPSLPIEIANVYGSQAVALCLDYKKDIFGRRVFVAKNGSQKLKIKLESLSDLLYEFKFGELIVQNVDADGTYCGLDFDFCNLIADQVDVPVIVAGGAKSQADMQKILKSIVSGAMIGSLFVFQHQRKGVLVNYNSSWVYENS